MELAAPSYNKPANWKELSPDNKSLLNGVATPKSRQEEIPVMIAKRFK